MKKPIGPFFLHVLAVGVVTLLAQSAQSQGVVYQNTTGYAGNFNVDNATAGNEIVLAGSATSDYVSQLSFQFSLVSAGTSSAPQGSESVELTLYQNNGPVVNGYKSPGTVLYNSGFSLIGLTAFSQGQTLTYNNINTVVPQDFTWAVTFAGVPSTGPNAEHAGLSLYNIGGGPSVGGNFGDAWYNNGSAWSLNVSSGGAPSLQFGATVTAVPEPSTISLGLMGVCGLFARRRKV